MCFSERTLEPGQGLSALVLKPFSERTTYSYDDAGRRTVQRNANGTRVSMAYDAASQATQVFHRTSAGATVLQLDYRYDNGGNRNVMIEGGSTARVTWSYDKQNQLLGEHRTGTNAYRQTFTYDAGGNRTLKNADAVRTTYSYDAANQLKYGQAVAGRTTYSYDATGNQRIEQPATGNRTTTTWNFENQPTQYRLPTGSPVTMTYNGDNRRVTSQQSTTTTKFVWDQPTDAYLTELDGSNAVQAVYTNEPTQYGSVVSQRRGTTTSIHHADALGSTRLLTTSAQTSSDTYLYEAWGNLITSTGTTVNPFRWVGRYGYYQDSSTGLIYVRARMYQPTIARWCSKDPIGYDGSYRNLFEFVESCPPIRLDPSGLETISDCVGKSGARDCNACCTKVSKNKQAECILRCAETFPLIPVDVPPDRQLCSRVAYLIKLAIFIRDPNGNRFWEMFTSGRGLPMTLTNDECLSVMAANPLAVRALADATNSCSNMSGVSGSANSSETLKSPWKSSLGGVNSSLSYFCGCYCMKWTYSVSDNYDWNSILRTGQTHRTLIGEVITLGFDLAQTFTRCRATGNWKEFPISGSCGGGTCP